jgi:hypothetical protein
MIARHAPPTTTATLRRNLRNAPGWWRSRVDVDRRSRGLEPLFAAVGTAVGAAVATAPPPARRSAGTLVLACCPGESVAVVTANDRVPMAEFVARGAWDDFLGDVADGRAGCELRDCHQLGSLLASTADGSLVFSTDRLAGLLAVATLPDGPWERMLFARAAAGGIAVSIAFSNVVHRHVDVAGSRRRAIVKARLRHIALVGAVPRDRGEPAYRAARAFAAAAGDDAALRRAMDRARGSR